MSQEKVYSGIHPRANINGFPPNEKAIVKNISEEFYVTIGCRKITIGQSVYRYFFLKFPDVKATAFGVQNEIIVLLSEFDNFEPRTLDALEIIQRENEGFRLDKICAFVVSKDSDFINKVDKLIKSQKESRIITPFTYSELATKKDEQFYRTRIKKYFFERNLFDFDSPLRKDLYFFGREDICQTLVDKHHSGQNGALFGLRRSGKTSILLSVCRRLESQNEISVLIDCEQLHLLRWWDALYYIAIRLNDEQRCKIVITKESYTEFNASIEFDGFIGYQLKPGQPLISMG